MISASEESNVQKEEDEDDDELSKRKTESCQTQAQNAETNKGSNNDQYIDRPDQQTNNNCSNDWLRLWLGDKYSDNFKKYITESTTPEGKARYRSTIDATFKNTPESLKLLMYGAVFEGSIERDVSEKPEWLDLEKLKRGQKFARKYIYAVSFAELLSLFTLFSFPEGLKPLIFTGNSGTPYTAFKRYLSTVTRVINWYTYDQWTVGTPAYNDIVTVRKMHENVRKRLREFPKEEIDEATRIEGAWCPARAYLKEDFQSTCPVPAPGQCPYMYLPQLSTKFPPLSQGDMLATQFGFVGLLILYPKSFGIHNATDEDLHDFCHVWRSIGYLLGIEDEFNLCRGTLADVKQRCSEFLELWVKPNLREISPEWEHMMRCVVEGMLYYFPGSSYEVNLLYFADLLHLHMPRLRKKLSLRQWFRYNLLKIFFKYLIRIPGLSYFVIKGYHHKIESSRKFSQDKLTSLQNRSAKTLEDYRKSLNDGIMI